MTHGAKNDPMLEYRMYHVWSFQLALWFTAVTLIIPVHGDERWEGDYSRNQPYHHNHALYPARCPLQVILDRLCYRPVPVQTYGTQVNNRRCAEKNI